MRAACLRIQSVVRVRRLQRYCHTICPTESQVGASDLHCAAREFDKLEDLLAGVKGNAAYQGGRQQGESPHVGSECGGSQQGKPFQGGWQLFGSRQGGWQCGGSQLGGASLGRLQQGGPPRMGSQLDVSLDECSRIAKLLWHADPQQRRQACKAAGTSHAGWLYDASRVKVDAVAKSIIACGPGAVEAALTILAHM